MQLDPQTPTTFHDSIQQRAKLARWRGVGNPFAFLNDIGLVPVRERLFKGATLLEVAEELGLPLTALHVWIENEGHEAAIEEASVLSAEGYVVEGQRMLRVATTKFELDKAKAMIEHGRWMASKKDKKTYGNTINELGQGASVSYVFNIGNESTVQINTRGQAPDNPIAPVPADPHALPKVSFSLEETNPFQLDRPPDYLQRVHSDYPAIAPLQEPKDGV
ncbi:MAG TPA: hypothetical protein VN679_15360 [Candidatus Acidoferrales bacterium]|jgi:hypothetical protein|nr:hypothetical protein [Candidatus Acidoferrales bacterium]